MSPIVIDDKQAIYCHFYLLAEIKIRSPRILFSPKIYSKKLLWNEKLLTKSIGIKCGNVGEFGIEVVIAMTVLVVYNDNSSASETATNFNFFFLSSGQRCVECNKN